MFFFTFFFFSAAGAAADGGRRPRGGHVERGARLPRPPRRADGPVRRHLRDAALDRGPLASNSPTSNSDSRLSIAPFRLSFLSSDVVIDDDGRKKGPFFFSDLGYGRFDR